MAIASPSPHSFPEGVHAVDVEDFRRLLNQHFGRLADETRRRIEILRNWPKPIIDKEPFEPFHLHYDERKRRVRQFIVTVRRGRPGGEWDEREIPISAEAFGVAEDETGATILIFTDEDGENTAAFRDWQHVVEGQQQSLQSQFDLAQTASNYTPATSNYTQE